MLVWKWTGPSHMAQLREENLRLKRLVANLTLDKDRIAGCAGQKMVSLRGVDRWWSVWLRAIW
jgi:hypothetical protein